MKFKVGDKYKCIKAPNGNFTEGEIYTVENNLLLEPCLIGNGGFVYSATHCTVGHPHNRTGLQFEKVKGENEMEFKIGDKVCGKDRHSEHWLVGDIVVADKQCGYRIKVLNADVTYAWLDTETINYVLEETPKSDNPLEEQTPVYSKEFINKQIAKAYQHFDTDAERLAYLRGYFAK